MSFVIQSIYLTPPSRGEDQQAIGRRGAPNATRKPPDFPKTRELPYSLRFMSRGGLSAARERSERMKLPSQTGPIHFVGIGGIGMSGIAEAPINLGQKMHAASWPRPRSVPPGAVAVVATAISRANSRR
jgi:hypothetical protein